MEFSSIKELYERLLPALSTKVFELKRNNIDYIKKEDIWNYLKTNKWKGANNLLLHEMVDDILNIDSCLLENYVKRNIHSMDIKPILESEEVYE